jgi:hypothetical protein
MSILQLVTLATEEGAGIAPYLVGGGSLLLLVLAMVALLAFGKGREHS